MEIRVAMMLLLVMSMELVDMPEARFLHHDHWNGNNGESSHGQIVKLWVHEHMGWCLKGGGKKITVPGGPDPQHHG